MDLETSLEVAFGIVQIFLIPIPVLVLMVIFRKLISE